MKDWQGGKSAHLSCSSHISNVSAASFSHDSDFPTFSPATVSWTSPTARQPPCRALTLNLTVSLLTPAPAPGRGRPHLPPRSPAAHSRPGKGYKRQPQGGEQQDTDGTGMRRSSSQIAPKPLPSATLIRQTARPGSSWDGQISSLLSVPRCWLPCFARPSAAAGGDEFGLAVG